jgi:hypothetical protein
MVPAVPVPQGKALLAVPERVTCQLMVLVVEVAVPVLLE